MVSLKESVMSVYLAGPLGFTEAGREFHYHNLIPLLQTMGFSVLDPWKLTDGNEIAEVVSMPYGPEKRDAWSHLNKKIGGNNQRAIETADFIVAVLDGTDVDSGTAAEVGYAFGLGKRVYGYRSDFRLAGDNEGCPINLQVEYFVLASGGGIASSLIELEKMLRFLRGTAK